ncbi:MAG TPA: glycosyltransferase family 1 protein [Planctomycetes bacterium]|nr:glycosyltransferase family 1 protein [Planctomycetota bacterium]
MRQIGLPLFPTSSSEVKVFLVSTHFIQYGLELAGGLAAEGAQVCIAFCPRHADRLIGPQWRELLPTGVEVCELPFPPRRRVFSWPTLRNVLMLRRKMRRFHPDVVHLQSSIDPAVALVGLLAKRPVVVTVHDVTPHLGEENKLNPFLNFLEYRVVLPVVRRKGIRFIVHGESLRGALAERTRVPIQMITKVPHGVLRGFVALDAGVEASHIEPTVLFFGRMEPYKGVDVLAKAVPLVRDRIPESRFVFAGKGTSLGKVQDVFGKDLAVEIHDEYVQAEDVGRLFRQATVVAAPYLEASQSGVIAVAFAFGVPVVATRVGALPEVVRDKENGLLVEPGDPAAFADSLCRVLEDPELTALLRAGARKSAEGELSWRAVARKTLACYRGAPAGDP